MSDEQSGTPDLAAFHHYEYQVDLHGDNALAYVVELAGEGKKILELGAGSGMQTQFLAKDRRNEVVAAEINPASIEKLRKYVDKVYPLDLNAPNWVDSLARETPFDTIIAADVLEHLYDPWTVLRDFRKLLAPDGEIVISLPYAGNSAILGLLYDDNFDYREEGLLDKTHIRFFGLRNIVALHKGAGLTITDARIVLRPPQTTEFHADWNKLPRSVRKALSGAPYGDIYQVVTVARASETTSTDFCLLQAAAARCASYKQASQKGFWQALADLLNLSR